MVIVNPILFIGKFFLYPYHIRSEQSINLELADQEIIIRGRIRSSVGEKLRKKDFNCDHHNSMGLKSGEYGDKFTTLAPTGSIICSIDASLCTGKLSITTTAPSHNSGGKKCSINDSNAMLAIELFIVINPTTSLILTAPKGFGYFGEIYNTSFKCLTT